MNYDGLSLENLVARMMSERDWQAHVEQAARLTGWLAYHTYDSRRSPAGFPDLVLLRGERLILAELKTQRGWVRPEQRVWLEALAGVRSVEAHLWRPADRDEVLARLMPAAS